MTLTADYFAASLWKAGEADPVRMFKAQASATRCGVKWEDVVALKSCWIPEPSLVSLPPVLVDGEWRVDIRKNPPLVANVTIQRMPSYGRPGADFSDDKWDE